MDFIFDILDENYCIYTEGHSQVTRDRCEFISVTHCLTVIQIHLGHAPLDFDPKNIGHAPLGCNKKNIGSEPLDCDPKNIGHAPVVCDPKKHGLRVIDCDPNSHRSRDARL